MKLSSVSVHDVCVPKGTGISGISWLFSYCGASYWWLCLCRRHYWAFKVEPHSYMVKVGVASDSKLLEWFHSPRDTSSPRFVSPPATLVHANMEPRCKHLRFDAAGTPDTNSPVQ